MKKDKLLDLFQTTKMEESQTMSIKGGTYTSKYTSNCLEDASAGSTTTQTTTAHDVDGKETSSQVAYSEDVMS